MKKNKIHLFDIDKTLFDTSRFKNKFNNICTNEFHIGKETLDNYHNQYIRTLESTTDFDFFNYISRLQVNFKIDQNLVNECLKNNKLIFSDSMFEDVLPALRTLSGTGIALGIFSEGYRDFQLQKLIYADILHLFDKDLIFISRRKMNNESISQIPTNSLIVDDKLEVIQGLENKIHGIWLNRDKRKTINVKNVTVIHTLIDLLRI